MSTDDTSGTTTNDMGSNDGLLTPMEGTDSDDVHNRDGDEVVDPPENWSGVDKFGMSADEQAEGESLDERLAQEEPDVLSSTLETDVEEAGADEVAIGSDVAEPVAGLHHGQIDGAPEDGDSLFPVVN
jgi:hypothetical protein